MTTLNKYKSEISIALINKGNLKRSDLKKEVTRKLKTDFIEFNVIDFNMAIVTLLHDKQIREIKDPELILEEKYAFIFKVVK